MKYKTENDIKLSKYIQSKIFNNQVLPTIRIISNETGISIATISRFGKRNGFFDFPEMRRKINKSLITAKEWKSNVLKEYLKEIFYKRSKLFIVSSSFTFPVGQLIFQILKELNMNVDLVVNNIIPDFHKNDYFVFTSISGMYSSFESHEKMKQKANSLLITFFEPQIHSDSKILLLKGQIATTRINEFQLIHKMFNDVGDVLNNLYIEVKQKNTEI